MLETNGQTSIVAVPSGSLCEQGGIPIRINFHTRLDSSQRLIHGATCCLYLHCMQEPTPKSQKMIAPLIDSQRTSWQFYSSYRQIAIAIGRGYTSSFWCGKNVRTANCTYSSSCEAQLGSQLQVQQGLLLQWLASSTSVSQHRHQVTLRSREGWKDGPKSSPFLTSQTRSISKEWMDVAAYLLFRVTS